MSYLLNDRSAISFSSRVVGDEGSFFVAFRTFDWVFEYPLVTDFAARTVFFVNCAPTTMLARLERWAVVVGG